MRQQFCAQSTREETAIAYARPAGTNFTFRVKGPGFRIAKDPDQ